MPIIIGIHIITRIRIRTDIITLTTIPMALNGSAKWLCNGGVGSKAIRDFSFHFLLHLAPTRLL